jgi:hypothetical protein
LWDRWQRGKSLKAIGRVFGKPVTLDLDVLQDSQSRNPQFREIRAALNGSEGIKAFYRRDAF